MTPLFHALNISTLAAWLSVASLGTVGVVVKGGGDAPVAEVSAYDQLVSISMTEDFSVGEQEASQETDKGDSGEAADSETPFAEQETLPAPPEMPELTDLAPLPELPDLPQPVEKSAVSAIPAPAPVKASPRQTNRTPARSSMPTSATGGSLTGKPESKGKAGNGGTGGGSGMSDAKRLAGGRMPPPSYPSEAKRKGQEGTVTVEFVVDASGRVISAFAKSSSPWPTLNDSAVSCVRRWKFPPGSVTKYTRPITFRLN